MIKHCMLIRHAVTKGNERRAYLGCGSDEGLSEKGREEAGSFAEKLSAFLHEDTLFFSSPLKRATETAQIIMKALSVTGEIQIIDKLREIDFGVFEGKNHEQLDGDPAYQAWIDSGGKAAIPGGESREEFINRSIQGFKEALDVCGEHDDIAIVCHGGNIMAVMSTLAGGDYYDYMTPNLGGYYLEIEKRNDIISVLTFDSLCERLRT